MTPRELADRAEAVCEDEREGYIRVVLRKCAATLRAQADEIDALKADRTAVVNSLVMIARFARPHAAREKQRRPSHDSGQIVSSIEFALERYSGEHDYASPWISGMRDEIDRLKEVVRHAEYWEARRREERDALAAEVRRLQEESDQWEKTSLVRLATWRERVKAEWKTSSGPGGWIFSRSHAPTCERWTGEGCTCGADAFRRLMEE